MSRPRVLILDDEASVRESLGTYLADEGYSVDMASGIEEALAAVASGRPDVAIVDLRLGGASGESFIIRARCTCPGLRVLLHTASNSYQLPPTLRQIGLTESDVLQKPVVDLAEVSRAIDRVMTKEPAQP